jgi:hypothetical protein
MKMRTVKIKVCRNERWYPEYDVPAHLSDDEAQELIANKAPDQVYDDYVNKNTYDADTWIEIITEEKQ